MDEDKREKIRLASDEMLNKITEDAQRAALEQFRSDRLTVLNLTEKDKRFLKDLKIGT